MKHVFNILALVMLNLYALQSLAQGAIKGLNHPDFSEEFPVCGSHQFLKHHHTATNDLHTLSNQMMEQISIIAQQQNNRNYENLLVIPVVFHVVYNNDQENLADSIILNQLEILNEAFRRHNENASQTRPEFLDLVGDTKIEFELAELDPSGQPTNGITRTNTTISHFGGILPFASSQTAEINQWVNDSLYYNWFRLTQTDLGGIDPWDTERYLNIWIGDLRIFEPLINNFEELVFVGLATPPVDHPHWPADIIEILEGFTQGVLMHYVAVGANNPNVFPNPYQNLNTPVKKGKILVHEVGHYLGLRHIWGDGDCSLDDYILDTPNAVNHSNWGCNLNANSCIDNINGADLPNMVENYMDYSSGTCQNSFTIGQADLMRSVLEIYRPLLAEVISTVGVSFVNGTTNHVFPNPFETQIHVSGIEPMSKFKISDLAGKVVAQGTMETNNINLSDCISGSYILEIISTEGVSQFKLIKE